jgi:hypothetical protein
MTDINTGRQSGAESDAMSRARQAASGAAESASNLAGQASGLASKAASALASEAQHKATGMMQQQMEMGADYVRMVSQTAHTAARELEGKAPELARLVHDIADRADSFANDLRRRQVNEMFDVALDFARRNPRMFLGGAIAAGFLLTRFAKSSAEHKASMNRRNEFGRGGSDYGARSGSSGYGGTSGASTGGSSQGARSTSPSTSTSSSSSTPTGSPATRTPGGSYAG